MKRKIIIPLLVVGLILSFIVFWHQSFASHPTLVFKGYDPITSLEHARVMRFELRNTTKRPIWVCNGPEPPLTPQVRDEIGPSLPAIIHRSFSGPDPFGAIEKIAPDESVTLEWVVLDDGKPVHAGIAYYVGNFTDVSDFAMHCFLLPPDNSTPWKGKIYYYWNKPFHPRHVIDWPEPLTFQTENPKSK